MTTQEYVDYVSKFNRLSIEDLLTIIKMKMRLSKKTTESFVFAGSRYIIEAPEKQNIITIKGKKTII
jgi:hypothetical protein